MIHATLVLLVDRLEHVVHGLGGFHAVSILLSPPQTQVQTELKGVVMVGVEDEGIDLGDLHDLAVGAAVGTGLQNLALGRPMGIKSLLRENDAAALATVEHIGTVHEPCQHLQIFEGDDGGVIVGGPSNNFRQNGC